jgi:hypothetical protein
MSKNVLFPTFLPSVEAVKLGRFITNIKEPSQSYDDPAYATSPIALTTPQLQFISSQQTAGSAGLGSSLSSLLSLALSQRAKREVKVTAEAVKTYTLDNVTKWFREATSLDETKEWLERTFDEGEDIFFIIGFRTILNAQISEEIMSGHSISGKVQMPISAALASAGIFVPLQNIDPSIGGHHQSTDGVRARFIAPGENVCALQYLKLRQSFFSSSQLDKSKLSRNPRWNVYDKTRNSPAGVDDIIEVDLEGDDKPEGDWEIQKLEGEEILISK